MAQAEKFSVIMHRAAERKGGRSALATLVSRPLSSAQLAEVTDSQILAEFTKKVFQSGFVWRVVRQKWPSFCEVFFDFNIEKMLLLSDEMLEQKAQDPRIIRNLSKVFTIRENALMLYHLQQQYGSAAKFIAQWPSNDIIGLWAYLKKHGARLGGNTGPYALRALGKDTFLLTQDVEAYLRAYAVFDGGISSKRSMQQIQQQFSDWQQQSGLSLQEVSQILAYSIGENYVGMQR